MEGKSIKLGTGTVYKKTANGVYFDTGLSRELDDVLAVQELMERFENT